MDVIVCHRSVRLAAVLTLLLLAACSDPATGPAGPDGNAGGGVDAAVGDGGGVGDSSGDSGGAGGGRGDAGGPASDCSPAARAKRSWSVLKEGTASGVWMAGALLADGTPLLVGGQANLGAIATLSGAELTTATIAQGPLLTWASVAADGTALVVGNGRRALWRTAAGVWSEEELPGGDKLWGCLQFSKDDAWAVGADEPTKDQFVPVVLRRTASGWSKASLPTLSKSRAQAQVFKIDGHDPNDVLAVGDTGLALRWDGKAWTEEETGVDANLVTVRKLPGGAYVAVGGTAAGLVMTRKDTGGWSKLHQPMVGVSGVDVFGDQLIVAGNYGWIEHVALADGKAVEVDELLTTDVLHFVLRLPDCGALAGGGNLQVWPNPMQGTLLRFGP